MRVAENRCRSFKTYSVFTKIVFGFSDVPFKIVEMVDGILLTDKFGKSDTMMDYARHDPLSVSF